MALGTVRQGLQNGPCSRSHSAGEVCSGVGGARLSRWSDPTQDVHAPLKRLELDPRSFDSRPLLARCRLTSRMFDGGAMHCAQARCRCCQWAHWTAAQRGRPFGHRACDADAVSDSGTAEPEQLHIQHEHLSDRLLDPTQVRKGSHRDRRCAARILVEVHDSPPFNQKRRTICAQPVLSFVGRRGTRDAGRSEGASEGEGHLGDPRSPSVAGTRPRPCPVRARHRQ